MKRKIRRPALTSDGNKAHVTRDDVTLQPRLRRPDAVAHITVRPTSKNPALFRNCIKVGYKGIKVGKT